MRRELECSIWSERDVGDRKIDPPVRGYRTVRSPLEDWLAFSEWFRDAEQETSAPRLADLCADEKWEVAKNGSKWLAVRGVEIRELAAEAAALSPPPDRPAVSAARDQLLLLLREAIDIVNFYEGKPFIVKVLFIQRIS
jgi:hypothetical protein